MQPSAAAARRVARPWVGPLARVGLTTKGIVYLLVGGLAVLAVAGKGGKVDDSHGAVRTIGDQPYGDALLVGVAIGLLAYAVWRALQATIDLDRTGGAKGAGKRIAYSVSAIIYFGLAATAVQLALGEHAKGEEPRTWVARLLAQPFGNILVVVAGLGIAGYGVYHLWKAVTTSFEKNLDLSRLSRRERSMALWVGRIGITARGIVFGIVGYHLVMAGIHARPGETRDAGGAMRSLANRPHGSLILGLIAAGLVLYGTFMLVRARLGRIPGSDQ